LHDIYRTGDCHELYIQKGYGFPLIKGMTAEAGLEHPPAQAKKPVASSGSRLYRPGMTD